MPVKKNPNGDDWCMGSKCGYKTKKDAEAAERAYYASMKKKKVKNTDLVKSLDKDKQIFTSIVLKANYRDDDGINQDYWSEDVVAESAWDFMLKCQQNNIQHLFNTDIIKVVESYISPVDFEMGNGMANKGDWIMSVKILDDDLWKMCLDGEFKGFSIGCGATVEIEDED